MAFMTGKRRLALIFCVLLALILSVFASGLPWKLYPGEYEVVQETYVTNPSEIDISSMDNLKNFPVDDPSNGMDWKKVQLPRPCVNGENENTYIMVSRGTSENILIYMQGGGAGTGYLTSLAMVRTLNPSFNQTSKHNGGIFNRKENRNPFKNWTIIFIPYSTGDVHSGNRVVNYQIPLKPKSKTVHHAGAVNVKTTLRWVEKQNIAFDNIVLGGSSAGGYGTVLNTYLAEKIFQKPIIVINDAGPGLSSKIDSTFGLERTMNCWGWDQNLPSGATEHIKEKGEPIYGLEKILDNSNSVYAFCEDQMDIVIGPLFLKYPGIYFRKILRDVSSDFENSYHDSFSRFLEHGMGHTFLSRERFYSEEVGGTSLDEWVDSLLEGKVDSYVEDWDWSLF